MFSNKKLKDRGNFINNKSNKKTNISKANKFKKRNNIYNISTKMNSCRKIYTKKIEKLNTCNKL